MSTPHPPSTPTSLPQVQPLGCASDPCTCASKAERAGTVENLVRVPAVALSALKSGQTGVIAESNLSEDDGKLLRAMGLSPGRRVVMCRTGEPCIVAVVSGHHHAEVGGVDAQGCRCAARIGLARPLAEKIMVSVGASGEPARGV